MRFLVDARLPPALARWLAERGHTAEHGFDIGLHTADDRVLWDYAVSAGAVITNDEDFALRRTLVDAGPSIVSLCRVTPVVELPTVIELLSRGEPLVEIA
jgi:predicted nuclease of predicted toxin-antitoxin system